MVQNEINVFHWADYVVFSLMLVISAGIGFIFGWIDRKKKSTNDFLLGGGDLKPFPVGISILASFTSAIAILGFSAEMYRFGTMYWIVTLSYPLTQGLTAFVFIPLFHELGITSAYQYLELRFNYYVRITASIIFSIQTFLYMSVALYTPALAIEQVTKIPLIFSIVGTGAICALYTVIGGMKATVWIDTFQVAIMFIGLITIVIKGSIEIEGGFVEVWKRANYGERLDFFDFDPNPLRRHTFWTLFVGGFFTNLTVFASNQGTIQRYLSVKKTQNATKALLINLIGGVLLLTITCLCGLVAYAKYYDCDLLTTKKISRIEQLLPYLVMDILGKLHGLPGLFVATIYSAALSTISGGMNSLAAVFITDFVKPAYFKKKGKSLNDNFAAIVTKALALGFGAGAIGLAYLCQYFGNTILQLSLSIFGLLGGPLLGVFCLGMFIPYINWIGALSALLISTVLNLWLGLGGILYGGPVGLKPINVEGCSNFNITTTSAPNQIQINYGLEIYKMSYLYYSLFACIISLIIGLLFTFITEKVGLVKQENINHKYYVKIFYRKSKKVHVVEKENNIELITKF